MGTIADKLQKTLDNKKDVKEAILYRGIPVDDNFSTYGEAIKNISGVGILDYTVMFKSQYGNNIYLVSGKNGSNGAIYPPFESPNVIWHSENKKVEFPLRDFKDRIITEFEDKDADIFGDGSLNTVTDGYNDFILVNTQKPSLIESKFNSGNINNIKGINDAFKANQLLKYGEVKYSDFTFPYYGIKVENRGKVFTSDDGLLYQTYQHYKGYDVSKCVANADSHRKTIVFRFYGSSAVTAWRINTFKFNFNNNQVLSLKGAVEANIIDPLVLISSWSDDSSGYYYYSTIMNIYDSQPVTVETSSSIKGSGRYSSFFVAFSLKPFNRINSMELSTTVTEYSPNYGDGWSFSAYDEDLLKIHYDSENVDIYGDGSLNTVSDGYNGKILLNGVNVNDTLETLVGHSGNYRDNRAGLNKALSDGYEATYGVAYPYPNKSIASPLFSSSGESAKGTYQTSSDGKVYQAYENCMNFNTSRFTADATQNQKTIVFNFYGCSTTNNFTVSNIRPVINGNSYTIKEAVDNDLIQPLVLINSSNTYDQNYFRDTINLYNGGSVKYDYSQFYIIFMLKKGNILNRIDVTTSGSYTSGYSDGFTFASYDDDVAKLRLTTI